jgi:hypothetical protein
VHLDVSAMKIRRAESPDEYFQTLDFDALESFE